MDVHSHVLTDELSLMKYSEAAITEFQHILHSKEKLVNFPVIKKAMDIEEYLYGDALYNTLGDRAAGNVWESKQAIHFYTQSIERVSRLMREKEVDWLKLYNTTDGRNFVVLLQDSSVKKTSNPIKRKSSDATKGKVGTNAITSGESPGDAPIKKKRANKKSGRPPLQSMQPQVAIPPPSFDSYYHQPENSMIFPTSLSDNNIANIMSTSRDTDGLDDFNFLDFDDLENDPVLNGIPQWNTNSSTLNQIDKIDQASKQTWDMAINEKNSQREIEATLDRQKIAAQEKLKLATEQTLQSAVSQHKQAEELAQEEKAQKEKQLLDQRERERFEREKMTRTVYIDNNQDDFADWGLSL